MIYTITFNPACDRSIVINDFAAGKVNRIISTHDDPGGKGINVSKIIHELGGESIAMGIIGGKTGMFIKSSLESMGILTDFVVSDSETRTNIKISDPVTHITTDINDAGAPLTSELALNVLDKITSSVKSGDMVVLAGKTDTDVIDLDYWITTLKSLNARVLLDTEGKALKAGAAASPFMIKPNVYELSDLTGKELKSTDEIVTAALKLSKECGIDIVLVSRGEKGAVCVSSEAVLISNGVEITEVCSTGAGDSMLGAMAYSIHSGASLADAFRFSIAAGTAAVTCPGSKCPSISLINEILKQVTVSKYEQN